MVCDCVCGWYVDFYNHYHCLHTLDQSHFRFLGSRCTSCTSIINCVHEIETTSIEYGHIQYKLRLCCIMFIVQSKSRDYLQSIDEVSCLFGSNVSSDTARLW